MRPMRSFRTLGSVLSVSMGLLIATASCCLPRGDRKGSTGLDPAVSAAQARASGLADAGMDAEALFQRGEQLKSEESFEQAAPYYIASIQLEPEAPMVHYQLACVYALWGKTDAAVRSLQNADAHGFWDGPTMRDDSDLASIRYRVEYKGIEARALERYAKEAPKHAGGSAIRLPEGTPPAGGWPVAVMMHGYGSNKDDFVEPAEVFASTGIAAIALSGPLVMMDGTRYRWPPDSFETTHKYVQETLGSYRKTNPLLNSRIAYLAGFSEGALHAWSLVASHPESYAGVFALSPGGRLPPPAIVESQGARPVIVVLGKSDYPFVSSTADTCISRSDRAHWPVRKLVHEGGHTFPEDWQATFKLAALFLLSGGQ